MASPVMRRPSRLAAAFLPLIDHSSLSIFISHRPPSPITTRRSSTTSLSLSHFCSLSVPNSLLLASADSPPPVSTSAVALSPFVYSPDPARSTLTDNHLPLSSASVACGFSSLSLFISTSPPLDGPRSAAPPLAHRQYPSLSPASADSPPSVFTSAIALSPLRLQPRSGTTNTHRQPPPPLVYVCRSWLLVPLSFCLEAAASGRSQIRMWLCRQGVRRR